MAAVQECTGGLVRRCLRVGDGVVVSEGRGVNIAQGALAVPVATTLSSVPSAPTLWPYPCPLLHPQPPSPPLLPSPSCVSAGGAGPAHPHPHRRRERRHPRALSRHHAHRGRRCGCGSRCFSRCRCVRSGGVWRMGGCVAFGPEKSWLALQRATVPDAVTFGK